jgi:hypothetical protein
MNILSVAIELSHADRRKKNVKKGKAIPVTGRGGP